MIATLAFGPRRGRVRPARFVPRPSLPVDAACVLANGVREGLRTLLGEACSVTIGEPVALGAPAWRSLTHDAHIQSYAIGYHCRERLSRPNQDAGTF